MQTLLNVILKQPNSPFKKLLEKKNENLHYWKKKVTSQPLMGLEQNKIPKVT